MKFLATAHQRGYCDIISGMVTAPPSEEIIDITTQEGKSKHKVREANYQAHSNLVLSCSGETCFKIVGGAVTNYLQEEDARMSWMKVKEK